jgi:hypothetical protein
MQEVQCPLCFSLLEVRDVAPCDECGGSFNEIEDFRQGKHKYRQYEIFPPLRLTLCNFCDVDFGSWDPAFFGLPGRARIGYQYFRFIGEIENPVLSKDRFCPACGFRLRFLRFVDWARRLHASQPYKGVESGYYLA